MPDTTNTSRWTVPPGLTDPLPHNWHRLTWRRRGFVADAPPFHVVSSESPSIALLRLSLEQDPAVITESITEESWDDPR